MSLWTRVAKMFRNDRLNREIDEELQSHIEEAIAEGRNPDEVRRAFGSALKHRDNSRDARIAPWLDSVRADMVFAWRQFRKKKAPSAAAIVSLALAIGACTTAFRLIDALLLRPLPVAGADRLYLVAREGIDPAGNWRVGESSEYPLFLRMRQVLGNDGSLIAASYVERIDLTYSSDDQMEKANRQYVSGVMFPAFGLQPAAGRLLTEEDDRSPRASPYAVISYDYWTRRFNRDQQTVGRKVRLGNDLYEIIGVLDAGFTGTEPGTYTDVYVPAAMHPAVQRSDSSWFRTLVLLNRGVSPERIRDKLHPILRGFQEERARGWSTQTKQFLDRFLNQKLLLEPAASGISGMQRSYRLSLIVLGVLVAMVLLIACANVANLLAAQAAARAREMALRVSIGAGRWRLVQMVVVESACLGFVATLVGGLFSWWAAPFVVRRIGNAQNPTQLFLPADWRVLAFGLLLAVTVTSLFALAPALRVSAVRPASALRGGDDAHARRRLMHALIAVQVAFCFIVHFAASMFVSTSERLANQPVGFAADRLLVLETGFREEQPAHVWNEVSMHLRSLAGVESVSISSWPLLSGGGWNGFIWVDGAGTEVLSYFLGVSPEWREAMKIPLLTGRDFKPGDSYPGVALVNQTFVQQCLKGQNPIGRWFEKETGDGKTRDRFQVVGIVADTKYRNMREPATPIVFVPFHNAKGEMRPISRAAFLVRTQIGNPTALAGTLRKAVTSARPELRVSNIRTQTELIEQHTIRERMLAMLALFFAFVAVLLAGVGLYGVLDYNVLQRQREIGIRLAIGASVGHIARRVTTDAMTMVIAGSLAGIAAGMACMRYVETLLYQVKGDEWGMFVAPATAIVVAMLVASLPAVIRAVRVDPLAMVRSE
jgi:predicted permease